MKEKLLKTIVWIIVSLIIIAIAIVGYFMIVDIETKLPNEGIYTCNIEKEKYRGRKVFIITPKNKEKTELKILYFHGGAYMAEADEDHWAFIEKIVNDTGATVIFPDYPLTPKHNYKAVFEMVEPLYKEIIEKIDVNNLLIIGDSAGAGLSLALEQKLSKADIELPNKTILISPWLDVRLTNPKIDEVQKYDKNLSKEGLKLAGIAYAGEDGIDSYLVNPIDGDVSKMKEIIIFTGTYDILNPDIYVFKERAKEQNKEIIIKEYEGKEHDWLVSGEEIEEYKDFLQIIKE